MRSALFASLAGLQHVIQPNRLRIGLYFAASNKGWVASPNNSDIVAGMGFAINPGTSGLMLLAKDVGDIVRSDWYAQEIGAPSQLYVAEILEPPK